MLDIYEDGTYGFYDANGNSYDQPSYGIYNNYLYGAQPQVGANFSATGTWSPGPPSMNNSGAPPTGDIPIYGLFGQGTRVLDAVYSKSAPVTNACFWGAWTAAAAGAGAMGAAAANGGEIVAALQADFPSLYGRGVNWLFRKGAQPGYPGTLGTAWGIAKQSVSSACSTLQ